MQRFKLIFVIGLCWWIHCKVHAQLTVNVGQTATQYAQQLVGAGVVISNAQFTGAQGGGGAYVQNTGGYNFNANVQQIGSFSNGSSTNLGLDNGITLSTGEVTNAEDPDQTTTGQYPSGYPDYANSYDGDPDLNALTSSSSYNCAVLEFDFVPIGPHISFSYVFASSEYPGWVGSSYNDVFGFFLSGPGISGPYSNNSVNIATVPSTTTPVYINTINGGSGSNGGCPTGSGTNAQYYVNNCNGTIFPFRGFTTVLTAEYDVQCGQTYHIKLAIGDVDDVNWDSAIFLKMNSLVSSMLNVTPDTTAICPGGSVNLDATLTNDDGTGTFTWQPDGQTTEDITVSPAATTEYIVEYNKAGCIMRDTALVIVGGTTTLNNITPGPCNNGTYDVSGSIDITNPPTTGDLIVEDCNGNPIIVASAPFTQTSYPFTITGLNADGNACTLTSYFSVSPNCNDVQNFTAPAPCNNCAITNLTANIGACDPATSTFGLSGTVEFSNAPTTGQLIVEDCNGNQQTFNAPFTSPLNYTITGINADGAACDVTAYFSADPSCTSTISYTNPGPCSNPCNLDSISVVIAGCDATTSTFDLTGSVYFSNAPTTGQLIIEDCNGNNQTFNAPFTSPQAYSIPGITADGAACGITAHFTADPSCSVSVNYTNPADCSCLADVGNFDVTINSTGGATNGVYRLCYGDTLSMLAAGGYIPPNDVGADPTVLYAYHPAIAFLAYSCPPTVFPPNDITTDPCLIGIIGTIGPNGGIYDVNTTGAPPNFGVPLTNNTVYYVPITMYDTINGIYAVNSNGVLCFDMGDVFTVQYLPEITSSNPVENCQDGTFEITISGGLPSIDGSNFTASNLIPTTATFVNTTCTDGGTIQISGLQDGDMYSFDVTDANGCPITISGGPFVGLPTADAGTDATAPCGDLTYTLAANPSVGTGTWTGPAGVTFSNPNSPTSTVTVPSAGDYTLTWTEDNGNGCTDANDVVITFIENPTYTTSITNSNCGNADGEIILTTTAGMAPFTFSIDGGATTQNNGTFSNLAAGTYSILITDDNGCQVSGSKTITDNPSPTIDNVTPTDASCHAVCDGSIQITINGGTAPFTFNWTDANGNAVGSTEDLTNLCVGIYNLTVTDDNNCTVSQNNIAIAEPAAIDSSFSLADFCEGTTNAATNIATPGGTFSFNPAATDGATIDQTTGTITNGVGGTTYTVQYEATVGGCSSIGTQTVTVLDNPEYTAALTDATCDIDNGEILINATSGMPPYNYSLDEGNTTQTSNTFTNLSPSNYGVQVSDANGCLVSGIETITQLGSPAITNIVSTNPSCYGECDGSAQVIASGGSTPYNYTWSSTTGTVVGSTDDVSNLCKGSYTITITDNNGCSIMGTATLTQPSPVDSSFIFSDYCAGEVNNPTNIATPGGTFSFNPAVTDGASINATTGEINNGVGGTTYTVQYEATVGGCSSIATQDVTVQPIPAPNFNGDKLIGCEPLTVNFTDLSDPTGNNNSCVWDFGDGTTENNCSGNVSHTYSVSGTYTVTLTVTSANGCVGNYTVNNYITVTPRPVADFIASSMEVGIMDPAVQFENTSQDASNFTWTFGDESPAEHSVDVTHSFTDDKGANYIVTLIASNNDVSCNDTIQKVIRVKEQVIYYVPNTFTPDGDDFNETFRPVFTSGYDPYDYTLLIFNRWGEIIFESHNAAIGWDGTYHGKIVPDGTYVWKIIFKEADSMSDKHHTVVGSVNVLR